MHSVSVESCWGVLGVETIDTELWDFWCLDVSQQIPYQLVFVAQPMKHEFLGDARENLGPQSLLRAREDVSLQRGVAGVLETHQFGGTDVGSHHNVKAAQVQRLAGGHGHRRFHSDAPTRNFALLQTEFTVTSHSTMLPVRVPWSDFPELIVHSSICKLKMLSRALLSRPQDRTQFAKSRFALGRGASEGVYPSRYSTERATKPQGKTALARRVAALLACGFGARRVTERCGYAPLLAPRHKPKSPATNCVLSCGLV